MRLLLLGLLVLATPAVAQQVLWDQRDLPSGDGIPDQDFETEFDEFDCEAADDFVVDWPDGWRVEVIRTLGDQSLERQAESVDVAIHADVGGRPAAGAIAGCRAEGLVPATEDDGSFELRLPEQCDLPPGRYWLSLQTNQKFNPFGQHFWSSRTQMRGLPALWRNPNNGFDTGCRDWNTLAACEAGGSFPDLLFALEGSLLDPPPVALGGIQLLETGSVEPAVAVAPSGLWAAAWRRDDRVEVRRYDDVGKPLGSSVQVFRGSTAGPPQVGIDELGGVAVVWERPSGGLQARFYDESGVPARPVFQIAAVGRAPALARGPAGLTVVVWQDTQAGGVLARLFDRDGIAVGSPIAVDALGTGVAPAVAMGRDGAWSVVWRGADATLRLRSFGPNGGSLGIERVVAQGIEASAAPAVASRGARFLTLVWPAAGELFAASWEAGLGPIGEPMAIATVGSVPPTVRRIVASGNSFGETGVVWQIDTGANARIFVRMLAVDGSALGSSIDLGFGRGAAAAALDPAGQLRLLAERGGEVVGQRLLIRPGECGTGFLTCVGGQSGDRFAVRVAWKAFDRSMGLGVPQDLTPDTGWFWFFGPENVEVVLKVLDGRAVNGNFWVFYAALSNVEFTVSVVDRETDAVAVYHNLQGQFASVGDTVAFVPGTPGVAGTGAPDGAFEVDQNTVLSTLGLVSIAVDESNGFPADQGGPDKAGPCLAGGGVLCLIDGRMQVTTTWRDFQDNQGVGTASPLAGDTTGYFWFFNPANVEVVTKILDGRVLNGRYWVFVGALSNVEFTITVQDLVEGGSVTYVNPSGTFASFADTSAL